ncbi:neural/ectodermal development factor IMP-L2-like [Maniola jurtina]|uniref:neural/ectodermal development factor IMP-L2-like n=1 Tax=Maniola jurtina TaxID=191418 RepID=UPI001E68C2E2|nr:neural/ectodermal development factor IMP-L2-like [Maniola jurtina]XP_045781095.1 neural/ectodermal development factor IMP-L2-like [Maniola jurtina]XP_045781096.1 neural/ectodermal development factor IMP-L2-like [Maniola jurtina]
MINLIPLLAAAALVSLQCLSAYARIDDAKLELDNRLLPNEIPAAIPSPKRRTVGKYVKISGPPPETARFVPGTTLVLECEIMGNPAPFAGWLKNGVPVSDFEEDTNEIFSINPLSPARLTSKFVIRTASNGDVFTCVASSGLRENSASTTVYVEGSGSDSILNEIMPSKPIITAFYNDLFQLVGTSATLPCRAFSPTKTQVLWMDNNENVVYGSNRLRVLPSGDLHISGISWDDMGSWTCSVKNAYGRDVMETFLYPLVAR